MVDLQEPFANARRFRSSSGEKHRLVAHTAASGSFWGMTIRPAVRSDLHELHAMIRELAAYERLEHEVKATALDTERALFGERPAAEALLAECDGCAAGFAVFYPCYPTFAGGSALYLEDLFVRESFRRRGLAKALLAEFLRIARERKCPKVEWRVLRWNTPAIDFYRSLGASILEDWVPVRVDLSG